jgi:NADPH2:quinone reductase
MQALIINKFGSPEVFERVDLPTPTLKEGEVLIEVKATSVNPIDYKIRDGRAKALGPALPAVLHSDVSGIVVQAAAGTPFQPGDEVYGCAGGIGTTPGALAQFMAADARLLALKPRGLRHEEAAALPLVSLTAWEGLVEKASLTPGDHVLIHGGTGGVGHLALQLAKLAGAIVSTTVSSDEKARTALALGADHVINYKQESVPEYVQRLTQGQGFDVVFDTIGGKNLGESFAAARLNGQVISISTSHSQDLSPMHSKGLSLHVVFMLIPLLTNQGRARHGEILRRVARLVEQKRIRPLLDPRSFRWDDIGRAHAHAESGQSLGKIVVSIS